MTIRRRSTRRAGGGDGGRRARCARHRGGRRGRHPGRRPDHRPARLRSPPGSTWSSRPRRRSRGSTSCGRRWRPRRPPTRPNPNDPAYDLEPARRDLLGAGRVGHHADREHLQHARTGRSQGRQLPRLTEYNPNAPRPAQFADFMQAVATRYNGFFIPRRRHGAAAAGAPLRDLERAEPEGFFSVNGRSTVAAYQGLVKAAYPKIKLGNTSAQVIAGVGGPRSTSGAGQRQRPRVAQRR